MGDVDHVIEYVSANYAQYGVQHDSDGDGVVNFTVPPKIRNFCTMIKDIESVEGVATIDQMHDGDQLLLKVYVKDGNIVNLSSGTVVVDGAWMKSMYQAIQRYMSSTPVLICLGVVLMTYYRGLIRAVLEDAYMRVMDQ